MKLFDFFFKKPKKDDLFNSHPDGIFVVESDGKILEVNSRVTELFKTSGFDMCGQFFSKYVQGGSSLLNQVVKARSSTVTKALTGTNEEIFVELTASQNPESGNVYVCIREVTGNYKLQNLIHAEFEACKNVVDKKNLYLASVSNELLSSLNTIVGFSRALLDGIGGELLPKQEKYVQIINKNSAELDYDFTKMLNYFKLESGLIECEPTNFDIINHLNTALKPYEDKFRKKMLTLTYDFSSLVSRNCYQDAKMIDEILTSLVDAIYKNMDVGTCSIIAYNPSAELLLKQGILVQNEGIDKKYVVFEVKDSTTKYNDEELENITNPYYITKEPNKRAVGVRFTYASVEKYLKKLGGKIWVTSKDGNVVSVLIPVDFAATKED